MAYEELIKPEYRGLVFKVFKQNSRSAPLRATVMVDPELEGFITLKEKPIQLDEKNFLEPIPLIDLPQKVQTYLADYEVDYPFQGTESRWYMPEIGFEYTSHGLNYRNWAYVLKWTPRKGVAPNVGLVTHRLLEPATIYSDNEKKWVFKGHIWKMIPDDVPFQENKIMNSDETPVEINISSKQIDESFATMFGTAAKMMLQKMFGAYMPAVKIKGKKSDISAFADALGKEKQYMETFRANGLDSPKTYRSKAKLDTAVAQFERKTGLKWPFK